MRNKIELMQLLAEGETAEVIRVLNSINFNNLEIKSESVILSARFKRYEQEKYGNLSDSSSLEIEINKINQALLHLLKKIPDDKIKRKNKKLKLFGFIALSSIALLAIIAFLSGHALKDVFSKEKLLVIDSTAIPSKNLTLGEEIIKKEQHTSVSPLPKSNELIDLQQQKQIILPSKEENKDTTPKNNNKENAISSSNIMDEYDDGEVKFISNAEIEKGTTYLLAIGVEKTLEKAKEKAKIHAINKILFAGIAGSNVQRPIVDIETQSIHKTYFETFLKAQGPYLDFIVNTTMEPNELKKITGGYYRVGVYVKIHYRHLQIKLANDGIIKKFGI